jgi:outer membrane protein OmpA-like peptidoglycan-associated protein
MPNLGDRTGLRLCRHRVLITAIVIATLLPGCEYGRRYINKPWGNGTWIPAAVCAAVGAGVGVGVQALRSQGSNTVTLPDGTTQVQEGPQYDYWKGAAVGAPAGAVLCGLVGHAIFDEEPPTPTPIPTPTPEPPPPPSSKRIVLRGVNFDFDESAVRPDSRPILDEAAEVLREHPDVDIAVEGYTDDIGTEEYNEGLAIRRAQAVFRYLVNHGVAPERMEVIGYGESHPVATNETEAGRAQNRRVELHVKELK